MKVKSKYILLKGLIAVFLKSMKIHPCSSIHCKIITVVFPILPGTLSFCVSFLFFAHQCIYKVPLHRTFGFSTLNNQTSFESVVFVVSLQAGNNTESKGGFLTLQKVEKLTWTLVNHHEYAYQPDGYFPEWMFGVCVRLEWMKRCERKQICVTLDALKLHYNSVIFETVSH